MKLRALLALLAVLALATTAFAAPAREGVVSAAAPVFAWDGGPGNGAVPSAAGGGQVRCTPGIYECEDTLVEVKDAGDLRAEIKAGDGSTDLDVAIYASDSAGTAPQGSAADAGDPIAEDISEGKDAKATAKRVKPGFYVVRVRFYAATAGVYKGTATLVTAAAPAPAPAAPAAPAAQPAPSAQPAPTAQPQPASKPKSSKKRKACEKKAKKIKNAKKRKAALKRCKKIKN